MKCGRCSGLGKLSTGYVCRDCAGTGLQDDYRISNLTETIRAKDAEIARLRKVVEHYKYKCPVCHGSPHNVPFRDSYQVLAECPVCKPAREALQASGGDTV